jgi:hypothetical protein
MGTLREQLQSTKFKGIHSELLSVGKCALCKTATVWIKKGGVKLSEAKCGCGNALKRTTFETTLKLQVGE